MMTIENYEMYDTEHFKRKYLNTSVDGLITHLQNFTNNKPVIDKLTTKLNAMGKKTDENREVFNDLKYEITDLERMRPDVYDKAPWGTNEFELLSIFGSEDVVNTEVFMYYFTSLQDNYSDALKESIREDFVRFLATFRLFLTLRKQWIPQGHLSQTSNVGFVLNYEEKILEEVRIRKSQYDEDMAY